MSVDISTLAIQVQSDGVLVASNRLNELSNQGGRAERSTSSLSSATDRLAGYLKAAAAALATWKLSEYIKEATLLAARVETLGVVLKVVGNNAGYTGAQMDAYAQQVKKMGITTQESMSSLIKMASAQMDLNKASQLARVAQDAAVIGNINSSEAFGRMIHGIRSGETEILRTIGINVQFEQGYKNLAATLGKTSNELTATEKVASRMNQVLDYGKNIAGAYEASMGTAGKQIQSMSRYTEELKLKIGAAFTPALTDVVMGLTDALKLANDELGENTELIQALGRELVNPMGLLTDFRNLIVGTAQAVQFFGKAIASAPGAITLIGVAAYSATGGIAALSAAFTALTAAILASLATNPVGWLAAVGGATYLAAKSAVKSLDALGYAYAGVNLTGEAYYEAEQRRAKKADEAWENVKKKAVWMYREGGIKSPLALQDPEVKRLDAADAAAAEQKKKEAAAKQAETSKKAAEALDRWRTAQTDLRNEIALLNPALTEHDRTVMGINAQYGALIKEFPAHKAALQGLKAEHLAAARAAEQWKEALAVQDNMDKQWEGEQKLRAERATTAAQYEIQLKEQQGLRQEALELQIKMENAALTEKGIYEGQVKDLKDRTDELRRTALAEKELTDQKRKQQELVKEQREVESANRVDAAYLNADRSVNSGMGFGGIDAQLEAEKIAIQEKYNLERKAIEERIEMLTSSGEFELAQIDTLHQARMAAIEAENKARFFDDPSKMEQASAAQLAAEKGYAEKMGKVRETAAKQSNALIAALNKSLALTYDKQQQEMVNAEEKANRQKLSLASDYTAMVGGLFASLADTQDQSSRKGFEAAKDYNLAAAIVSTAAAVMNALATVQPYPAAVAAAAMAAATGAIQIAKIESTSFGGGSSSVSAPSGSFTASGGGAAVGSAIGKPYRTVQQSQDADSMNRLADSMDNASLEMRRVADGLVSFQDVLSTDLGKRNIEGAPNRFMETSNESSWLRKMGGLVMDSLGFESTKYIRNGDWGALFGQLKNFSLMAGGMSLGNVLWGQGNKWRTTGGGVSLGIEDGDLSGMTYTDRKKSGGLFKSSKKKTVYSALDEGFAYWLENTLGDVGYSTNLAATILGTKANIGGVQLPATKIKTAGRSTEDIQKDLEKWFQTVGNAFAKTVEGLEAFTAPGEEAFAALMRLSMALQDVNANFNLIGKTLIDSSLAGGNSASKLTDLFGGLEGFNESMATYFESMFTDAEQKAALQKQAQIQVNASFKEMGLSIPKTREEFKSLVNSLDVTTEKGASLFAALMDVVPAFTVLTEAAEEASKRLSEAFLDTALSASSVLRDIMAGSLSTMTPRQILMQQEASFASALASGNTAILPELGRQILETSRQVYGSGSGYTTNYNNVTSALAGVAGIDGTLTLDKVERQIYAITAVQDAVNNGTARLVTSIAELKEEIAKLRQQQGEGTEAVVDAVTGTFAAVARA